MRHSRESARRSRRFTPARTPKASPRRRRPTHWPPRGCRNPSRGGQRELQLHALGEPDHVSLGVREQRDRDLWELRHRQDRLPTELLGLVEGRLRVVGANVERDVAVAVGRLPDAAADAAVFLLDHGVRHVTRDLLGLPAEELAVERLERVEILPRHFEMQNWMSHYVFLSYIDGAFVIHGS